MRMAALTIIAPLSATTESIRLNLQASSDARAVAGHVAALDERRVQVEVVRHDGGAEDADGDVEFVGRERAGRKPPATARHSGRLRKISTMKQAPMIATRATIRASILRMPNRWITSKQQHVGRP